MRWSHLLSGQSQQHTPTLALTGAGNQLFHPDEPQARRTAHPSTKGDWLPLDFCTQGPAGAWESTPLRANVTQH